MGELQKRAVILKQEQNVENQNKRRAKARQTVLDVFWQVFDILKE